VWLAFFKKASGKPSVDYDEAVEEALCFGWVDTKVRALDAARYAQWFCPRKPKSAWSDSNIARVKRMIAAKKMTAAGLAAFEGHAQRRVAPLPTALSPALERRFKREKPAWKNFAAFPPGYRRMAIAWVASAKREETQERRLAQLIDHSARNERLSFI